jgi:hypothetical protein
MPRIGVSITKSTTFRGAAQEFANTYYYETPSVDQTAYAGTLITALVDRERPMHASSVNFVRARAWSAGGTKAENQQLEQRNLSGTGSGGTTPNALDRERAFLVRARAGNDSKGRPVYLRKWWHLGISIKGGESLSDGQMGNTATLGSGMRNALVADFNSFKTIITTGSPTGSRLVSEKGREIDGDTVAHPYLEHHQLGDMWR